MSAELIEQWFAGLRGPGYRITSPVDAGYNCVAWAAGENDRRWWPDPLGVGYWPACAPRALTIPAFVLAFADLGYVPTADGTLEPGVEKVVLFADAAGTPTHMARQLPGGAWSSKLGNYEDIEHLAVDALQVGFYGGPAQYLARRRAESGALPTSGTRRTGR